MGVNCRKFFGVSDGAYLIHNGISGRDLQKDISLQTAQYLMQSVDAGSPHDCGWILPDAGGSSYGIPVFV